ncbi:DEAD/DEAH box helicase family protein [Sphingobacterium populi]|uniref:DEAD/DEAH box helicase family protein n=1 Tax=Sphingobacterium sp. CFCC 11742 TaxID=1775560 RepID=UPI0018D47FFB|nr:DEAD/DEAH box helicase family protein [Sphingobacterium sp. CFCC 11742]
MFKNGNESISFNGSCNFTAFGLLHNAESLNCHLSSDSESSRHKIQEDQNYFDNIFNGNASHLEYLTASDIQTAIKSEFGGTDIDELLIEERELIARKRDKICGNPKTKILVEELEQMLEKIMKEPRFPFPEKRDIQEDAYLSWINNDKKGIFAMATGSGKTVTALNCLLEQYHENGFYKAIVVVPTQALALQWESEVKAFNFQELISTHTDKNWKQVLTRYSTRSIFNEKKNLIVITTYATFNRKDIQSFIKSTKGIESFIYIADEAHNIGSPTTLRNIPDKILSRIGLSATPERIYDDAGSKKLYDFFNSQPPYYTYRYTMKQAIDGKILCKYDYYPIFVELTILELSEYKKITNKLRKFIDSKTGQYKKEAEMLLLQRKRVIHKAENKKRAISHLLDNLEKNEMLNYTFVFVPEGFEPDYAESDSHEIEDEDMHIMDSYAEMFRKRKYKYHKFIGGLSDSQQILKSFEEGHIDVLLAMKCLDEGVDIPRTEHAIFCSSTGNPRQFVQRRGRVLRKSEGKEKAKIWDLIVVPPIIEGEASSVERNMFISEVKRVVNFAALAENQIDILYGELKSTCEYLDIDLFKMLEEENNQYN